MTESELADKLKKLVMERPFHIYEEWYGPVRSIYALFVEEIAGILEVKLEEYDNETGTYKDK